MDHVEAEVPAREVLGMLGLFFGLMAGLVVICLLERKVSNHALEEFRKEREKHHDDYLIYMAMKNLSEEEFLERVRD